ncbi:MAG: toxin-antitoxin system HicB family antitoxin [Dehalococcoidia bacterium]|nr:toxin-antitoxin system HicB family antitoxin [Dehalococcoidia bacterium]
MSIQTMFRQNAIALLHQALVESAERDGVSLNQYVVMLLARGEAEDRVTRRNDVYNLTAAQAN